jgi:methylamine dehydrogenase accessory protein MauD
VIDALIVSNVVLWIAVVALAAVVFALLRQVGVLHERVAPAGALVVRDAPRVGEPGPRVEVEDWRGRAHAVGATCDGDTLLFFLSPTCPVCENLLPVLHSVARAEGPGLRLVLASDGPRVEHEAFVRDHALDGEIYVRSTELGLAYQIGQLPYAVLLDADGVVRARGLVNTREHLESLFEARERGVASVQEYLERRARSGGGAA